MVNIVCFIILVILAVIYLVGYWVGLSESSSLVMQKRGKTVCLVVVILAIVVFGIKVLLGTLFHL